MDDFIRLTELSHGGGCGCKMAPSILRELLASPRLQFSDPALMVGPETSDDAAVYKINDHQALVATVDFFTPIVDDPFDFGRIAATNALSDIYAMGARPLFALAIVGMPVKKLPLGVIKRILEGGAEVCAAAGIAIAGGHSIDAPEPIYGLAAMGSIHPNRVKRNGGAKPGDVLILGKPLGVGILSAALKKGALDKRGYAELLEVTTRLNAVGLDLATMASIRAMTDVTGFGLLGHLLEICHASEAAVTVEVDRIPVLPTARHLAERGLAPGAADRNWDSYRCDVSLPRDLPVWWRKILCDPQTSGGLLVSCDPLETQRVLRLFHERGFAHATSIGSFVEAGDARIVVR